MAGLVLKTFLPFGFLLFSVIADKAEDDDWKAWKAKHGRQYDIRLSNSSVGENYRRNLWKINRDRVELHNRNQSKRFTMELNEFSDLAPEEIKQRLLGLRLPARLLNATAKPAFQSRVKRQIDIRYPNGTQVRGFFDDFFNFVPAFTLPRLTTRPWFTTRPTTRTATTRRQDATTTRVPTTTTQRSNQGFTGDWRAVSGKLGAVKNQLSCGSCWSFAAIGTIESRYAIKYGTTAAAYSEQQLLDCSSTNYYGNQGCSGGWPDDALLYVRDAGGVNLGSAYPYQNNQRACRVQAAKYARLNTQTPAVQVSVSETAIMNALQSGPVIAAIQTTNSFLNYRSGVFSDSSCSTYRNQVDHAVIIVGYGSDPQSGAYWVVRNSWGPNWGEKGYVRMARGGSMNTCNIMSWVSYPNIA